MSVLFAFALSTCSKEDDTPLLQGKGAVSVSFEHWMMGNEVDEDEKIQMNPSSFRHTSSTEESLQELTALDYIISNIKLISETGKTFVYPKDSSYFIISEEHKETQITLNPIRAGRYTSITFGVGVPYEKWAEGLETQKKLWEKAKRYGLALNWESGYRHLIFEGKFTSRTMRNPTFFSVHVGDSIAGRRFNYKEIKLSFPQPLLVSDNLHPTVHIRVDANKILDGKNKIVLSKSSIISDIERTTKIAENFTHGMFMVNNETVAKSTLAKKCDARGKLNTGAT